MGRFAVENLDQEERAFVESVEGIHQSLETLKILNPVGRRRWALDAMQAVLVVLVAAALKSGK